MRTPLFIACSALLVGCTCSQVEEIAVLDESGGAASASRRVVEDTLAGFIAWTGRDQLCLDEVALVRDVPPSASSDPASDPIGRYERATRSIQVEWSLSEDELASATRHELCHALDRTEDLVDPDPELWLPEGPSSDSGLPARLQDNEVYADTCEVGPPPPLERYLREVCDREPPEITRFMEEVVYPGAPGLDPIPDTVEVELGETARWASAAELSAVVRVGGGLAAVVWDGSLAVHFLDWGLQETAVVRVGDRAGSWSVGSGEAEVVLVDWRGGQDTVRIHADGRVVTSPARLPGAWSVATWGDHLVGLTEGDQAPVEIAAAHLGTGEVQPAGLPVMYGPTEIGWTEDGLWIPGSAGTWLGAPDDGWRYDLMPHPAVRLALPDGRWLGTASPEVRGEALQSWVVAEADGRLALPADPCGRDLEERLYAEGDAVYAVRVHYREEAIELEPLWVTPGTTPSR